MTLLAQDTAKLRTHQTEYADPPDQDTYLVPAPSPCANLGSPQGYAQCVSDLNKQLYEVADGTKAMFLNQDTNKEGAGAEYYASKVRQLLNAGVCVSTQAGVLIYIVHWCVGVLIH